MSYINKLNSEGGKLKVNLNITFILLLLSLTVFLTFKVISLSQSSTQSGTISDQHIEKIVNDKCLRTTPYDKPEEFNRAISLIYQRMSEAGTELSGWPDYVYRNCVNVKYADLSVYGAEGIFYFDPNSSLEEMTIYVHNEYKANDDLLTAFLISHELVHVSQFINYKQNGSLTDCYDSEISAFYKQMTFLGALNDEELNSLTARLREYRSGNLRLDSNAREMFLMLNNFENILLQSQKTCTSINPQYTEEYSYCMSNNTFKQISDYVKSSSYYKKQCSANN